MTLEEAIRQRGIELPPAAPMRSQGTPSLRAPAPTRGPRLPDARREDDTLLRAADREAERAVANATKAKARMETENLTQAYQDRGIDITRDVAGRPVPIDSERNRAAGVTPARLLADGTADTTSFDESKVMALKPKPVEPPDVVALRQTKTRMGEVASYHKGLVTDFDKGPGALLTYDDTTGTDSLGAELDDIAKDTSPAAAARLTDLVKQAQAIDPNVRDAAGVRAVRDTLLSHRKRVVEQAAKAEAAQKVAEQAYGERLAAVYGLPAAEAMQLTIPETAPAPEQPAAPEQVGTLRGIINAAQNAFDASRQALTVANGLDENDAAELARLEYQKAARKSAPGYDAYQNAEGWDAVKAFASNPIEVTSNIVAEGLAGSLPVIASGLGAGAATAGAAGVAGSIIPGAGNVIGAAGGFTVGMVAGTGAGSFAVEYGSKILEELQGAGMDLKNPESIAEFFSNEQLLAAAKEKAVKRGVPVAAFDALSAGIAGRLGSIIKAAAKTPLRLAASEVAAQGAAGGLGEIAGSVAAGDEISGKAVFGEVIGEVGPGAVEIAAGRIAGSRPAATGEQPPAAEAQPGTPPAPAPEATAPDDNTPFSPALDDELAAELAQSPAGMEEGQAAATEPAPATPAPGFSSKPNPRQERQDFETWAKANRPEAWKEMNRTPDGQTARDIKGRLLRDYEESKSAPDAKSLSQEPPVGDVAAQPVTPPEQKPTPTGSTPQPATTREPAGKTSAETQGVAGTAPVTEQAPAPVSIDVAQSAEQPSPKPQVAGSTPAVVANSPTPNYQVTVQQRQGNIPGYVQVDEIRDGKSTGSATPFDARARGADIPDVPDWLPSGRYTVPELREAIARGPESAPPADAPPAQPAPSAAQPAAPAPPRLAPERRKKLERELGGAKPRYSFGSKQFTLKFATELDKALYILAQTTPSKRDADFLALVQDQTGMTEEQARAAGRDVRAEIKLMASEQEAGELSVSAINSPDAFRPAAPAQSLSRPPAAESDQPQAPTAPTPAPAPGAGQSFEQAKVQRDAIEAEVRAADAALKAIPGVGSGASGLTPDAVKSTPAYIEAKRNFDQAFARQRTFNQSFTKQFKAELAAERAARRPAVDVNQPASGESQAAQPSTDARQTPPLIPRGQNTPAEFVKRVVAALPTKGADTTSALLRISRLLHSWSPENFVGMEVHVLDEAQWKAAMAEAKFSPKAGAAYNPKTNTLWLRASKMQTSENLVSAVLHEAGHFAERFALDAKIIEKAWRDLTDAQIEQAYYDYHQKDINPGEIAAYRASETARSEWVAQQFARVVAGKAKTVPLSMRGKLIAFWNEVKALATQMLGSSMANSAEFEAEVLRRIDMVLDENGEPKSKKASQQQPETPSIPTEGAAESPGKPQVAASNETVVKTKGKGKKISVGLPANNEPDLLNAIEQVGGAPNSNAKSGGEYDGFAEAFGTGVARLLVRGKKGEGRGTIDSTVAELADYGYRFDSIDAFYQAVIRAVANRKSIAKASGREDYERRFEAAFLAGESPRELLRGGTPITVDDLGVGDEFTVNGEKFRVLDVDEEGNVTIKDGVTRTLPPGTRVYPDKGEVKAAERDTSFGDEEPAAPALELRDPTAEEKRAAEEAKRKREQAEAIEEKAAAPLKGDAGDQTKDMFGGGDMALFDAAEPSTPTPSPAPAKKPGKFKVSDDLRKGIDDLLGTPAMGEPTFTRKFGQKITAANNVIGMIVRDNPEVNSRQALAEFINEVEPRLRPFSESLFSILSGAVDVVTDGPSDWNAIYSAIDNPVAEPAAPTPGQLSDRVREAAGLMRSTHLSKGPTTDPSDMMGPDGKETRRAVMSVLLGRKATIAESGIEAITREFARQMGLPETTRSHEVSDALRAAGIGKPIEKPAGLRTQDETIFAGKTPAELLAIAGRYTEYGPIYNRNVTASVNALKQSVDRGDKFIQMNADELAVRLENIGAPLTPPVVAAPEPQPEEPASPDTATASRITSEIGMTDLGSTYQRAPELVQKLQQLGEALLPGVRSDVGETLAVMHIMAARGELEARDVAKYRQDAIREGYVSKNRKAPVSVPAEEEASAKPTGPSAADIKRQISNLEYRMEQDRARKVTRPENVSRLAELKSQLEAAKKAEAPPAEAPKPDETAVESTADVATFTPEQATAELAKRGITVSEERTSSGKKVWHLKGKTFDVKEALKSMGARWYNPAKVWTIFSDENPTQKLANVLAGKSAEAASGEPAKNDAGTGRDADEDLRLQQLRERLDSAPDGRGARGDAIASVGADTAALISRGLKFGMPQDVVSDQIEDIALITKAYQGGKPTFLLGNGAGTGKTFVLGGAIRELRAKGAGPFVYVTMNQDLIKQIKRDLADYGVSDVNFHTYSEASLKGIPVAKGAVLVFDEAHNVKNADSSRGEKAQGMMGAAKFTIFASATPFENPVEASYMGGTGVFNEAGGHTQWGKAYGASVRRWKERDQNGNMVEKEELFWQNGKLEDGLAARQWFVRQGIMVTRPMRLPMEMVQSQFSKRPVDQKWVDIYNKVEAAYDDAMAMFRDEDGKILDAKNNSQVAMHQINTVKRILEAAKVEHAVEEAKRILAEGGNVVIFVETKADRSIGRYRASQFYEKNGPLYTYPQMSAMMSEWNHMANMMRMQGERTPTRPFSEAIMQIARAMHEAGIDYELPSVEQEIVEKLGGKSAVAVYTGSVSNAAASKDKDAFLAGKKKVIVATMAKGGTGLSLHDKVGNRPTFQLNINLPWKATGVDQVSGRVARYGLQSKANINWFFADNIAFERMLASRVGRRMRDMGALVKGIDMKAARVLTDGFDFTGMADVKQEAGEVTVAEQDIYEVAEKLEKNRRQTGDQSSGFFETPFTLAALIADISGSRGRLLEPSAGRGNLVRFAKGKAEKITLIEKRADNVDYLRGAGYDVTAGDFLELADGLGQFDTIHMNPPFERVAGVGAQDVAHVMKAADMLAPGGRLVAIMGEGAFFRSFEQERTFRQWLDDRGATVIKLPEDAFKNSNTKVRTRMVVIDQGAEAGRTDIDLEDMDADALRSVADAVPSRQSATLGTPAMGEDATVLNPPKGSAVPGTDGAERYRRRTDTEIERGYSAVRQTYEVTPNAATRKVAQAFLDAAGENGAMEAIFDKASPLSDLVKSDVGNLIADRLQNRIADAKNEPQRLAALADYQRFSNQFAKRATELGQAVQVLDALDVFTRNGALTSATQGAQERQDKMLGPDGLDAEREIVDALNGENAKVIDALLKDVKADVRKVKVTKKMVERVTGELPKNKKQLDAAIRDAFEETNRRISDILHTHHTQADAIGSNLVDKLTQEAGLSQAEAEKLAEAVRLRLTALTEDAKRKVLARLERQKTGIAKRVFSKTIIDKVVDMSNSGAIDQPGLRQQVAEELKLPRVTDALAKRLKDLTDKYQSTPEGQFRDRVATDILSELRKVKGIGPVDVATAIYYAHILSGYTTQLVNILSTAFNVSAEVANEVLRAEARAIFTRNGGNVGTASGQALAGVLSGAQAGMAIARSIMDTGYAQKAFDAKLPEVSPILELLGKEPASGIGGKALKGYAAALRYVTRLMRASDAVFYRSASEAFQRVAAAKIVGAQGAMSREETNGKIRDLLGTGPAQYEAAVTQAKGEGFTGYELGLRVGEILEQGRKLDLVSTGDRKAREATFNSTPRGALGIIAKSVGDTAAKIPALKLFVPFTNIVANVTNASLNYSPVGALRAIRGYAGEADMTQQQRKDAGIPDLRDERGALAVRSFAGTAAMVALLAYAMGGEDDDEAVPFITARGSKDANRNRQLRESGWAPYTIRIGDKRVSYLTFPSAVPLAFVGNIADGIRYNDLAKHDYASAMIQGTAGIASTLTEMSFLQGIADLFDTLRGKEGKTAERFAAGVASSALVPNLVKQIDRTFDDTYRRGEGLAGEIAATIPGLRQNQPALLNNVGKEVGSQPLSRFGRAETGDPLWDTLNAKGVVLSQLKSKKVGDRQATPEEIRAIVIESGPRIERRLRGALPLLRSAKAEAADKLVEKIALQERDRAAEMLPVLMRRQS